MSLLVTLAILWILPQAPPQRDGLAAMVAGIEKAAASGNREAIRAFGADIETLADFTLALTMPPPERIVIFERDRTKIETGGDRLLIEVFWERGIEGRLSTWTLDVQHQEGTPRIAAATRLAHVTGLYRLSLNRTRQFEVRDLTVRGTDLTLHLPEGKAFVADTYEGTTAVVLMGRGEMRFTPTDPAEQTQVRLYSGREALVTRFDAAFIRVRPDDFAGAFSASTLVERPPVEADLRKADAVFEDYIGRTLQINLGDLSKARWSITPQAGDMIAEIRTRKFGTLTYTRSHNDAEDITLFERRRRRNIAVYASPEKLASRGRFYSEDDLLDYDVLDYEIDTSIDPDRSRIQGTTRLRIRIRADSASTISLRLAESLAVGAVYAPGFGRLLHLRVTNQNALIVNLPGTMIRGTELSLIITYAGLLGPQELDREAIALQQEPPEGIQIPPEPRYLYSNRTYWYPQSLVSDYASVKLTVAVPPDYDVIATGVSQGAGGLQPGVVQPGQRARRAFSFAADRPVRYIACVISRLRQVGTATATLAGDMAVPIHTVATARQAGRARSLAGRAADIFSYYASILAEPAYPSLTLVFTERELPGGHSPAYFAVVDQPTQGSASWRNDPVNFDSYPDFFIAHEIAHQWWGQAVGWKNYHEQWISEGFAQYFAMLYAEQRLPPAVSAGIRRRMRETAISQSSKGPVYLGYRLGHVQLDNRVFRSIIYNKAAMVLHMLRLTVGDDAFFSGIRQFFSEWQYKKAGTGDFQRTMEKASGRDLSRFFEAWIFGMVVPEVRFTHRVEGTRLVLRLEQKGSVEFPVSVRLTYESGRTEERVVLVAGPLTEQAVELTEPLRSVSANHNHATLAVIR